MDHTLRLNNTQFHNVASLLGGLFLGGLAGFGAMLLLAPQSGKDTRDQISQESIKLQDRATRTYDELLTLSQFDSRKILAGTNEEN
jgi:gas vesicle protein